jgi:hypothetical protein
VDVVDVVSLTVVLEVVTLEMEASEQKIVLLMPPTIKPCVCSHMMSKKIVGQLSLEELVSADLIAETMMDNQPLMGSVIIIQCTTIQVELDLEQLEEIRDAEMGMDSVGSEEAQGEAESSWTSLEPQLSWVLLMWMANEDAV